MKPGWQSSEFWITVLGQVLALLALTGAISVGDRDQLGTALANAVTAICTLLSSTAVVVRYIRSRTELKSQQLSENRQLPNPNAGAEAEMKCLSLIQPWAALVVLGAKRYETRSWQTDYRGPMAIHASRKFPETARGLCLVEPFRSVLRRAGFRQSADLPRGVILGTVELVDCLPARAVAALSPADAPEVAFGDYRAGRWAWRLDHPVCLAVPLPCTGRLGLFEVSDLDARCAGS